MFPPARQAAIRRTALILAALLACLACLQAFALIHGTRERKRQALAQGRQETRRMAEGIDAMLQTLEPETRALADDLSAGRVPDRDLQARLSQALARTPEAFRIGINYLPYAKDPGKRLFSMDVVRENGVLHPVDVLAQTYNYVAQNWFIAGMAEEGWHEPHLSLTTGQRVAGYGRFIRKPGSPQGDPIGFVVMDFSLGTIRKILATASLGRTGYCCLLSPKGTFLAHPRNDWVQEERTIFQEAQATHDGDLWRCGEWALRGQRGELETRSYTGDQPIMLFSEPIPSASWTLEAAVFRDETTLSPAVTRRGLISGTCYLLLMGACLGVALTGAAAGTLDSLWRWQGMVSLLLVLGISAIWAATLAYPDPSSDQAVPVVTRETLQKYLAGRDSGPGQIRLPTGIFLKTLRLASDNTPTVVATGTVWQHYPSDFPKELSRGFLFPDAEAAAVSEVFHHQDAKGDLVEYQFQATLRQSFDQTVKYPFDQAVIRLSLWPRDFEGRVSLVPDMDAYHVLNPGSLPGVDKHLLLPGWNKERAYFGFLEPDENTNFGSQERPNTGRAPELSYQLVLTRRFLDPFVSALLPVIVVSCLLFALLFVGTKDPSKLRATGFKPMDILPASGSLLFPVIYTEINLRNRIFSSSLLYLEYFYLVMYAVILLVTANTLSFALGGNAMVHLEDNALVKLLYWPVVLGAFFVISIVFLY